MKLIAEYGINKEGKKALVGYTFEAETIEEQAILSSIWDFTFFGLPEIGTKPKYAGRYNDKDTRLVKGLSYEIPKNVARCLNGELDMSQMTERRRKEIENLPELNCKNYQEVLDKYNELHTK